MKIYGRKKVSKPKVIRTEKNGEIEMYLPKGYRHDDAGSHFKILLNEETSKAQKEKIIELINNYIAKQYCQ